MRLVDPDTPEAMLTRAEQLANEVLCLARSAENTLAEELATELLRVVRRTRKRATFSFLAGVQIGKLCAQVKASIENKKS